MKCSEMFFLVDMNYVKVIISQPVKLSPNINHGLIKKSFPDTSYLAKTISRRWRNFKEKRGRF